MACGVEPPADAQKMRRIDVEVYCSCILLMSIQIVRCIHDVEKREGDRHEREGARESARERAKERDRIFQMYAFLIEIRAEFLFLLRFFFKISGDISILIEIYAV